MGALRPASPPAQFEAAAREGASSQPASKSPTAIALSEDALTAHERMQNAGSASQSSESRSGSTDREAGEIDEPVPASSGPPLPREPLPQADDGWDCQWDLNTHAWFFHNRFTGKTQWENPRASNADGTEPTVAPAGPSSPAVVVTGYNPAIHGDYDPNAWYAQKYTEPEDSHIASGIPGLASDLHASTAGFNRFTGQFQTADAGPGRHSDEAKSKRQMNAFFDVDAAANADDGRSLKAERSNKRISKSELKAFKEKRKARKEEKRRAWLRD